MTLDLVKALNILHTDTILQLIREVVKKPHQIKGDQSFTSSSGEHQSSPLSAQRICPTAPPGHFLLLSILNECVNRHPNIDNKRDPKELQEVSQSIEAVGAVASRLLSRLAG